jgi:hypothetical protein
MKVHDTIITLNNALHDSECRIVDVERVKYLGSTDTLGAQIDAEYDRMVERKMGCF